MPLRWLFKLDISYMQLIHRVHTYIIMESISTPVSIPPEGEYSTLLYIDVVIFPQLWESTGEESTCMQSM